MRTSILFILVLFTLFVSWCRGSNRAFYISGSLRKACCSGFSPRLFCSLIKKTLSPNMFRLNRKSSRRWRALCDSSVSPLT